LVLLLLAVLLFLAVSTFTALVDLKEKVGPALERIAQMGLSSITSEFIAANCDVKKYTTTQKEGEGVGDFQKRHETELAAFKQLVGVKESK